jgi:hypothetical protein
MARYIFIHPENQYTFRPNSSYYARWRFLPDKERAKIIAAQLTYLDFHEWLSNNLRHHTRPDLRESDPSPLVFDVAEGFVRTDVLLYAAICEAALYAVAKKAFDSATTTPKPAYLLGAFLTSEEKIRSLGSQTFTLEGDSPRKGCKIGICYTKVTRKSDSTVTFDSLIKAARAINAINADLEPKLHTLRKARNTIHLGEHIARRQEIPGRFYQADRETARQVVEEMRSQLASYCSKSIR